MIFTKYGKTLSPSRDDQGDVVELFAGGEAADVTEDSADELVGAQVAMALQGFDEPLFAEFFVPGIGRFGQAVGVDGEQVAGTDATLCQFASPILKQADDGAGRIESIDGAVAA